MACTGSIKLECACAALNNFFRFFSFLKLSGRSPLKNAKGTSILKADYRKVRGDEQFLVVIELLARQIVVVVMYYLGSNSEMNVSSTFRSVEATTAALASESSTELSEASTSGEIYMQYIYLSCRRYGSSQWANV